MKKLLLLLFLIPNLVMAELMEAHIYAECAGYIQVAKAVLLARIPDAKQDKDGLSKLPRYILLQQHSFYLHGVTKFMLSIKDKKNRDKKADALFKKKRDERVTALMKMYDNNTSKWAVQMKKDKKYCDLLYKLHDK